MRPIEVTIHHGYYAGHIGVQTIMRDVEADLQLFSSSELINMQDEHDMELPERFLDKFFNIYSGYIRDDEQIILFTQDPEDDYPVPITQTLAQVVLLEVIDAKAGWLEHAVELPVKAA